jgi:SRSO17 transposase
LQQFISDSPWEAEELWRAIRREVIPSLGALEAWIVDETGWIKQGQHSVGVSHQYCGSVGKQANCQVCVEVVVSDGEIAAPAAGRLYLPQSWTEDRSRCRRAGVPDNVKFATKPEIALELLRAVVADGVEPAPVLADKVYGDCYEFRAGLRELGLEYCVQVTASLLKAWSDPALTLQEIAGQIEPAQWRRASWKAADGSTRSTRLALVKVWLGNGLRRTGGNLEPAWFLVDWPEGDAEPYHCFIAHFHREPSKARCLRASRSRWHVEQYFQREKTDLGLDHYEGRSWRGFHHHLVLSAVAYLFVTSCHLRAKKNFWPDVGTGLASNPAVVAEVNRVLSLLRDKI